MINFIELGKKIYDLNKPREAHRFAVFLARCVLHPQRLDRLEKFFEQSETLKEIAEMYPFAYEQVTRAFFFYKSTFDERMKLIQEHLKFLAQTMNKNFFRKLYNEENIVLWNFPPDETLDELTLAIFFSSGQRKEGLCSITLWLPEKVFVYQLMFWIARDDLLDLDEPTGNFAMYIGAIQGPNMTDSRKIIKHITKKTHAYRTKNLMLFTAQAVAKSLGLKKIFAVTNAGYYANNHIRLDRKLKTSFVDFWQECGGKPTRDKRFFSLPLEEKRKNPEEIPAHKRALYRRRFAFLDELEARIAEKINFYKLT